MNKRDKKAQPGQIARARRSCVAVVKNADWKIHSTYLSGSRANPEEWQPRGAADYVRDESETNYWILKHGNGRYPNRPFVKRKREGEGERREGEKERRGERAFEIR